MTATLIFLISIFIGILGANITGFYLKKYSFGFTGNTIAGVFGSVFLNKSFGRLGFSPKYIIELNNINTTLFIINIIVSFLGGILAVFLIYKIKNKMNKA
ncbi:hypothetical protein [Tenacibaculum ovolyticum]|uniref:hypothetical protein n=1 Tax=Tenacibaculum ovolyticum TaxID=104270 RepID=UPI0003FFAD63|nr:hypothetical protein [Tenacibaculum ovolyticum]